MRNPVLATPRFLRKLPFPKSQRYRNPVCVNTRIGMVGRHDGQDCYGSLGVLKAYYFGKSLQRKEVS
jgi:hypothetical protein